MKASLLSLLVLPLLLTACGEDPLSAQNYAERRTDAWCRRYADCGGTSSYETCKKFHWWEDRSADSLDYEREVVAGRIRFDADAAEKCLTAFREASCTAAMGLESFNSADPSCYQVYQAAQELNGPCFEVGGYEQGDPLFNECKEGMSCQLPDNCGGKPCHQEVCLAETQAQRGKEGAACAGTEGCEHALVCKSGTCQFATQVGDECTTSCIGEAVCKDNVCAAPAEVVDGVTTCTGLSCDAFHVCELSATGEGICQRMRGEGEGCGPSIGRCDHFNRCSAETSKCVPKDNFEVGSSDVP